MSAESDDVIRFVVFTYGLHRSGCLQILLNIFTSRLEPFWIAVI